MTDRDLVQYLLKQTEEKDELNKAQRNQIDELNLSVKKLANSLTTQAVKFEKLIKKLTDNINSLTKQLYGVKSEKTPKVKVRDKIVRPTEQTDNKPKRQKPAKRNFEGLEEEIKNIYPDGDRALMKELKSKDIFKLKFIPAKVIKIIYRRWSYVKDGKFIAADYPDFLLKRCNADVSLLALLLANKYQYHLPVERQLTYFKNIGVDMAKSSLHSWVSRSISLLSPVVNALKEEVLKARYLNIDETTIPVLKADLDHTKKGYLWGVAAPESKLLFFDYVEGSRARDVIVNILKDYKGVIQTDGYSAYKIFDKKEYRGKIVRISCLAHIRRAIIEACETDPKAKEQLDLIAKIYAIEHEIFGHPPERKKESEKNVRNIRIIQTFPILKKLYRSIQNRLEDKEVLPRSKYRKAIVYTLNELPGLIRMIRYGYVRVDNNAAERMMKAPVLGRKNYLFTSEDNGGANRTADIYSLIESCKQCDIFPMQYLEDVMKRVQDTKPSQMKYLLPHLWEPQEKEEDN